MSFTGLDFQQYLIEHFGWSNHKRHEATKKMLGRHKRRLARLARKIGRKNSRKGKAVK